MRLILEKSGPFILQPYPHHSFQETLREQSLFSHFTATTYSTFSVHLSFLILSLYRSPAIMLLPMVLLATLFIVKKGFPFFILWLPRFRICMEGFPEASKGEGRGK